MDCSWVAFISRLACGRPVRLLNWNRVQALMLTVDKKQWQVYFEEDVTGSLEQSIVDQVVPPALARSRHRDS
jgi:hypothetical protein